MESWRGFSSEDIEHIQHILEKGSEINIAEDEMVPLENNLQLKSPTKILLDKRNLTKRINKYSSRQGERAKCDPINFSLPPEARLGNSNLGDNESNSSLETSSTSSSLSSVSQRPYSETSPTNLSTGSQSTVTILVGDDKSYKMIHSMPEDLSQKFTERNGEAPSRPLQKAFLLEKDKLMSQESSSLQLFQERQRLMEEQNKRKKELLTKAIADKKRQTQSEAKKIVQIQEELNRLDALLSTDVSILRNQIEIASYDFNEAQKRYDKAECEFIEAKMQLFSKLERKELLTEHLCKIIETNEQRKAKKLSELMVKLEISEEKNFADVISNDLPMLPYAAGHNTITCSTLKSERESGSSPQKDSQALASEQKQNRSSEVIELRSNGINKSLVEQKSSQALESINLMTAQNLDHRSENAPYTLDLHSEET